MAVYAIKNKTGTVYRYRFMLNGKEVQSKTYANRAECREAEIKAKNDALNNPHTNAKKMTLIQAFAEYSRLCPVRYHTECNRKITLKHVIAAGMGDMIISKVRPIDIENFAAYLRSKNYKTNTYRTYLNIFFGLFNWMVKREVLVYNPTIPIKLPAQIIPETEAFSTTILQSRLAYLKENYYPLYSIVLLMGYCGLRPGEACAINLNDIDFNARTVTVTKQYSIIDGKPGFYELKTTGSKRVVPIMDFAYPAIRDHANYVKRLYATGQLPLPPDKLMPFCLGEKGKRVTPSWTSTLWRYIGKEAGWKHVRFYALRHTFATLCRDAGVNIDVIADLLGHDDITVTKKIYAHKSLKQAEDAVHKLNQLFIDNNKKQKKIKRTGGL